MKKFEKVEKIGYHSNFNFECNTESGSKESLSIALDVHTYDMLHISVGVYMYILDRRHMFYCPTGNCPRENVSATGSRAAITMISVCLQDDSYPSTKFE